jgi:hypothetical protein
VALQIYITKSRFGKWYKPFVLKFFNNEVRRRISGLENFFRIIWLGIDLTIEWGGK